MFGTVTDFDGLHTTIMILAFPTVFILHGIADANARKMYPGLMIRKKFFNNVFYIVLLKMLLWAVLFVFLRIYLIYICDFRKFDLLAHTEGSTAKYNMMIYARVVDDFHDLCHYAEKISFCVDMNL